MAFWSKKCRHFCFKIKEQVKSLREQPQFYFSLFRGHLELLKLKHKTSYLTFMMVSVHRWSIHSSGTIDSVSGTMKESLEVLFGEWLIFCLFGDWVLLEKLNLCTPEKECTPNAGEWERLKTKTWNITEKQVMESGRQFKHVKNPFLKGEPDIYTLALFSE